MALSIDFFTNVLNLPDNRCNSKRDVQQILRGKLGEQFEICTYLINTF